MGKKAANESLKLQQAAASRYSDLSSQLMNEAKPQRDIASSYYTGIAQGGPAAMKVAAPEISYLKRQFANARQNVSDYVAPGGQKNRAQRDLAMAEPGAAQRVVSSKIEDALRQLAALGGSNTGLSLSATGGVSAAGDSLARLAESRARAVSSAIGGLSGLAGFAFGGGFGGTRSVGTPISDMGRG